MAPYRPPKVKKSKGPPQAIPHDEEAYQAAATEHEQAMGKHRGGDPEKSLRFARKALEVYSQGLGLFPQSFDLAYNKAHLELEIASHEAFSQVLDDAETVQILRQATITHQQALALDGDNADTLFNMAQVLTHLAEKIAEDDEQDDSEAFQCLERALDFRSRCWDLQRKAYLAWLESMQELHTRENIDIEEGQPHHTSDNTSLDENRGSDQERWARVVEPVTAATLVETITAQINTLSTLCSIINSYLPGTPGDTPDLPIAPQIIEKFYEDARSTWWLALSPEDRDLVGADVLEMHQAMAVLESNRLQLQCRSGLISIEDYKSGLHSAFNQSKTDQSSIEHLTALAEALVLLADTLVDMDSYTGIAERGNPDIVAAHAQLLWSTLIEAQSHFTTASKIQNVDTLDLAKTHLERGNINLRLHMLSYPPILYPQACNTAPQLLRNAEVYYRNAGKFYASAGAEERDECNFKEAVVKALQKTKPPTMDSIPQASPDVIQGELGGVAQNGRDWLRDQIEGLVDEKLMRPEVFAVI
ncbi:hypothetical protein F5Y15DRAFT_147333 [Xylariaceae sp. FL0016]|nr:hypothetical protein F5Y15DRAFT_147333 [Xylariaceae sp. FL0016]